jgi:polyphosphate kinase 2 (PPK2 family)
MLEKVDLTKKLSKAEYKAQLPHLRGRLYDLQKACWDANIPSVILFEGWDAAGKGTSINLLTQRLDPRGFKLYAIQEARTYEKHMPWLWRFWLKLPNYGEMAIFDRSWYGRVLVERVEELTPDEEWRKGYRDIVDFERTIADDGYVVIKFWLHISKREQLRRFKKLSKDPLESWHVQAEDWEHHRKYNEYLVAIEEMLERTDTEWGPWTIVEATDRRWTRIKIFETIVRGLEEALEKQGHPLPEKRRVKDEDDEEEDDEGDYGFQTEPEAESAPSIVQPATVDTAPGASENQMPLAEMGLGARLLGRLKQAGLLTVGDVVERLAAGDDSLLELDGIGPRSLAEIKQRLEPILASKTDAEPQVEPEA